METVASHFERVVADGQITSSNQKSCQALREKYPSSIFPKIMIVSPRPASTRGAYRDRHGRWKRDAVDARVLSAWIARRRKYSPRTAKARGPGPPMPGLSLEAMAF